MSRKILHSGEKKKKAKSFQKGDVLFNVKDFSSILKKIYLSGLIPSCALVLKKDGSASGKVMDLSSSIMCSCEMICFNGDCEKTIGLGSIDLLIKFLSSVTGKEVVVSFEGENRAVVSCEKKKSKLSYLLTDPELIPTTIPKPELIQTQIVDACHNSFKLTEDVASNINSYITMIGVRSVYIVVEDDEVKITGGSGDEHQFEVSVGSGDNLDDFKVCLSADFVQKVLSTVDFGKSKDIEVLYGGETTPVVFVENKKIVFAIAPQFEYEEDEEVFRTVR